MGAFKSAVITNKGQALMAKLMSGSTKMEFTKINTGDTPLTGDLAALTGIGTIRQSVKVAEITRQNVSNVKVSACFDNSKLAQGYYVRSLGLYAMDPQDGEILYSVSVADEGVATADYMPPFNGIGVSSLLVDLITAVSNASNVNVTVDPTAGATVAQIVQLQDQIEDVKSFIGYESDDIYGVEVDFVNKKFTRIAGAEGKTAGADFNTLTPWGGRKRCIVTNEGKVLAYYGETGYTETGALTTAITKDTVEYPVGTKVQVMVEQPIFYTKVVPVSAKNASSGRGKQLAKARYYVSPTPKTGFKVNPVFMDAGGIVQDKIYLGAFEGCLWDVSATAYIKDDAQSASFEVGVGTKDMLSSIAGVKPISGLSQDLTRKHTRILATNRGAGWGLHNIFALAVSQILMLVEYAQFDMQTAIGRGVCDLPSGAGNESLITGGTSHLGNTSGAMDGVNGKVSVTYRGEENLWGNIWTWLDGINIEGKGIHNAYLKTGASCTDDTKAGYDEAGFRLLDKSGTYQSAMGYSEEYDYLFLPTEGTGTSSLPVGDLWWCSPTYEGFLVAILGGDWDHGSYCGAWYLTVRNASSYRYRVVGGRLFYVPQTA